MVSGEVKPKLPLIGGDRFENAEQNRAHWERLADFWANEANEARRFESHDTAKIFQDGANHARDMANKYRLAIIGGK
jgi:hypothetical protein